MDKAACNYGSCALSFKISIMKKTTFAFIIVGLIAACKKESASTKGPSPKAAFSVLGDTANHVITIATYDQYPIINNSINSDSYKWDFGNDSTFTSKEIGLSYPKSGNYTLTLTVFSKDGQKSSLSKQVRVLDRVIKQVAITGFVINENVNHTFNNPKVWAVIKLAANNTKYPFVNPSFNAPVIYQTPVISNFDPTKVPYTFNLPGKVILDFPALATLIRSGLGYKGMGYGLELYAQDATGIYLLSSSYSFFYTSQTGSIIWPVADINRNVFIARYNSVDLICDYE